ncbi:MAG TPA: FG-GAP-like repeat-containing protein [Rubricoccaceae bacterium]|jgi:hypothetical protein
MRLATSTLALLLVPAAAAQTTFTEVAPGIPPAVFDQGPEDEYYIATVAPGDVDGDGDPDLRVLASYVNFDTGVFGDRLTLYRNDGRTGAAWAFAPAATTALPTGNTITGDIAWADYDGDGDLDAVVASFESTALYRNDGGTLVQTAVALPLFDDTAVFPAAPFDRRSISWADIDRDGDPDLLMPSSVGAGGQTGQTALLRNEGPGGPGGWTFATLATNLPDTFDAMSAWADADQDGDLDLLLQENASSESPGFVRIFLNSGLGMLEPAGPSLLDGLFGTAEWTDADGDGDLDVLLAGTLNGAAPLVRVLRRVGAAYVPETVSVAGPGALAVVHAASWADYDGDGDVDIAVTGAGTNPSDGRTVLFGGQGGTFVRTGAEFEARTGQDGGGTLTWFDAESDGDLDHLVSTRFYADEASDLPTSETRMYIGGPPAANAGPSAPPTLSATVQATNVTFSWGAAADDRTPTGGLTYNLSVRAADGRYVLSPMAVPSGTRMLPAPGNVSGNRTWRLRALAPGTYTWSVQAIDAAFRGGAFATGGAVVVTPVAEDDGASEADVRLVVGPNPLDGTGTVTLVLDRAQAVTVAVTDALGRRVALVHDGPLAGGLHALALDTSRLAPGVYVVLAAGESFQTSHRVTVLR